MSWFCEVLAKEQRQNSGKGQTKGEQWDAVYTPDQKQPPPGTDL